MSSNSPTRDSERVRRPRNGQWQPGRRRVPEIRYTRDARVPLSADDPEFYQGWQCIPIPPTLDDGWEIFDTSKDRKTGWRKWHWVEGNA
jgi:hypothetical protein